MLYDTSNLKNEYNLMTIKIDINNHNFSFRIPNYHIQNYYVHILNFDQN
jgi:hypothetical protein